MSDRHEPTPREREGDRELAEAFGRMARPTPGEALRVRIREDAAARRVQRRLGLVAAAALLTTVALGVGNARRLDRVLGPAGGLAAAPPTVTLGDATFRVRSERPPLASHLAARERVLSHLLDPPSAR